MYKRRFTKFSKVEKKDMHGFAGTFFQVTQNINGNVISLPISRLHVPPSVFLG